MIPQVRRRSEASGGVYIGRPTKWGNPFKIGADGTRAEVVKKHREWLESGQGPSREEIQRELRGRDLVCYCAPKPCHGNVLLEIANADPIPVEKKRPA